MFYAKIFNPHSEPSPWAAPDGAEHLLVIEGADYARYYNASFSPDCKVDIFHFTPPTGGTYAERKNAARDLALEWSHISADARLSYGELAEIGGFFSDLAKKYGLIREFREEGII